MRISKLPFIAALSVVAGSLVLSGCSNPTAAPAPDGSASGGTLTVSSANFTESEIIGNLYAEALKDAGYTVETKFNIGTREAYIPALSDGSIDLIPDYTGNLLLFLDKNADVSSPARSIVSALPAALEAQEAHHAHPCRRGRQGRGGGHPGHGGQVEAEVH